MRTDDNNNPTAFTTDVAKEAGLELDIDYTFGSEFPNNTLRTAKILGDPVYTTIRVIDAVGFYTKVGRQRWIYIGIPKPLWNTLSLETKTDIIGFMYRNEGGIKMRSFFKNYNTFWY